MAVKNSHKNIPLLFALGVILVGYAAGLGFIAQSMTKGAWLCLILGSTNIIICSYRIKQLSPKYAAGVRRRKYLLFSVLVIVWSALFVQLNYLGYINNVRWDLTQAKQHTLHENTTKLISNLHQEIRMTAFFTGLAPKYLEDLLAEYERVSGGKITTEIIDPIVQIGYASQFGSTISSEEQKVFVESGNERREVDFTDDVLTEEQLTNAVLRVTRKIRRVYFLIGHNEYNIHDDDDNGLKAFEALLATNHVISKRLMLGIEGDVPEDCDVLVIAGPRSHLPESENKAIQKYLENGGDALILVENVIVTTPEKPLTKEELALNPSLNSLLNDWGINVEDDIVVDLSSHASGDVGSPATRNYMAHRSIVHDLDYTFFIRPRSISIRKDRRPTLRLAPIILSSSAKSSWGERNRMLQVKYDEGIDRAGPVPFAFAIWEPKEEEEPSDTRIIVVTDADFISNGYIGQYSNARLGVNMINWLSEVDYEVFMGEIQVDVLRLDLTSKQKRVVGVLLFLAPLIIATIGMMVWIRQKIS